jgi:hypothetical protein
MQEYLYVVTRGDLKLEKEKGELRNFVIMPNFEKHENIQD